MDDDEGVAFEGETIKPLVERIVQKEIAPDYLWNAKSSDLQSVVIENILKELAAENENAAREGKRPFKFVVLCELQQNVGAGLANACTCHWDSSTDGHCVFKYETEHVQALVTVYGVQN
ncbi:hypothetical protein EMIHUDRAFT_124419 [Emiliania huxleyi CCMP1516]|uniref:Dynein light chain n=2 Tax=Emiliania huxleyi TaxID=2903 RepID=A0A0D3IR55_EMIH1|nr:hypothetical protein EMIHUDRAFT_124419 [Emiliania huxleyi CCMP1516]EOD13740.1 hypothetical protein EMIHUDRAFT_124419 [Emiliania huxleyi CCMP1516]|eukprot:XP_005766169.1 hypothetical protein EMIHUDRAFT_124419 [Emiliania huxleyi CCMP1516]